MKIVEKNVYQKVDEIEKKLIEKNRKSDFATKIYDTKDDLHNEALKICDELRKIKNEKARSYRLRMMGVLAKIETMNR